MASEQHLEVVGLMKEHHFQIAKGIAEVNVFVSDTMLFLERRENSWINQTYLADPGIETEVPIFIRRSDSSSAAGMRLANIFKQQEKGN